MFESVIASAPAKINLGLRVMKARADGFHNIASIFTTVNLCDTISVRLPKKGEIPENTCKVVCVDNVYSSVKKDASFEELFNSNFSKRFLLPEDNTFTKAYKAFCVLTGIDSGICVDVIKRIPAGGGLGGGSSDASSFIQSLNLLFGTQLAKSAQMEIAGKVGSDCFFFTGALCDSADKNIFVDDVKNTVNLKYTDYAAFVDGRGENVFQINHLLANNGNQYSVLLLLPGVSVSTKEAYSLVDNFYDVNTTLETENLVANKSVFEEVYKLPVKEWNFVNDFTSPIAGAYPKIKEALDAMRSTGADFVDMSGSGSTIFGVFEDRKKALVARDLLLKSWQVVLV